MGVLQQIVVHLDRPGRNPIELTPIEKSIRWTTLAVGGFGELSFSVAGDRRADLDRLSIARAMIGPKLLCEARLEDRGLTLNSGDVATTVRCFGLRRQLDDASLRRFWLKRDLPVVPPTATTTGLDPAYNASYGLYDPTNRTKFGMMVRGNGGTAAVGKVNYGFVYAPEGMTITQYRVQVIRNGVDGNPNYYIGTRDDAAGVSTHDVNAGTGSADYYISRPNGSNPTSVYFNVISTANAVIGTNDWFEFLNIALYGSTVAEDVPRGYYGGTLIRDLLSFCPGLQQGIIEAGSDFVLGSIDASTQRFVASVLQEITAFYAREWGVWEDGRFDWKTPQLDQEQWTCTLADLASLDLSESIDDVTKTTIISYTDAVTSLNRVASAAATDQRNPFVKTGVTRDQVVAPGFPMTAASAAQLAAKLVKDQGGYVPVRGRVTIPVDKVISNVVVQDPMPALYIRGGENLRIADLPSTDPFGAGRDGETLFHIISAEIDTDQGLITLDLEGLTRRQDVILARLAAATRTITG